MARDQKKIDAEIDREDAEEGARFRRKDEKARLVQEVKDAEIRKKASKAPTTHTEIGKYKKGGSVKSSASKRADGCATKGKTRGKMV